LEFREVSASEHSNLVTLRTAAGANAWQSGVIVEVRQPLRTRELLRHNARLIDLGAMASAICHELKQPLFTIALANASLQRLLTQQAAASHEMAQERATAIATEVARARTIIDRIGNYGRVTMNGKAVITPREAFDAAWGLLAPTALGNDIRVSANQTGDCRIYASRVAVEQLMVNALQNSFDAIAEARGRGGRPTAGLIAFDAHEDGENVIVRLSDDGIGIEDAAAALLFEPFFTTKAEKGGSGLGLFVMNQIVMESNGHIELRPRQPFGAILEMTFHKSPPDHDD
jgi:C4-dicarboxylate-specific signal transduction histidine kinase